MSVGYHGSSKMAVVATAALLSPSITAPLAVLQLGAFRYCRTFSDTFPARLQTLHCNAFLRPHDSFYIISTESQYKHKKAIVKVNLAHNWNVLARLVFDPQNRNKRDLS